MRRSSFFVLLSLCLPLSGCGGGGDAPQLIPTTGKITYQGKPLEEATVLFTPEKGPIAIGSTNDKGEFQLSTQGRPGATVGQHRVTIRAFEKVKAPVKAVPTSDDPSVESENYKPAVSRIPDKYSDNKKSELMANVQPKAADNIFSFDLK